MKGTESGKDKVKKICDILRKDTLEPAKLEAEKMIESARESALEIVAKAQREAGDLLESAREEIQRQRRVFQSSMHQACKQSLESLRQEIEEQFLNKELSQVLGHKMKEPKVLANLIDAVIRGIKEDSKEVNLSAYISSEVPARDVNALLAQEVLERLKEKSVLLGRIKGGIEIKLHKEKLTIDLSDATLRELVANYIRKDFRELIFNC